MNKHKVKAGDKIQYGELEAVVIKLVNYGVEISLGSGRKEIAFCDIDAVISRA